MWHWSVAPMLALAGQGREIGGQAGIGKRVKIIFRMCLTGVRCTPIIVSSLRRGARVAKGGRL